MDHEKAIAAIRAQGGTDEDVVAYLTSVGAVETTDPNAALHASFKSGRLAKNQADKNAAERVSLAGGAIDALLQAPQAVAAGVPGAKLAMSAGHSLLYGKPLADVQRDINERTSDIPYASAIGRGAGTLAALGAGPMSLLSAPAGGAIVGGAEGLLTNNPDASMADRVVGAGLGMAGGAVAGKAAEFLTTGARALLGPSLGKTALRLKDNVARADAALFGAAKAEGDAIGTSPEIRTALASPGIKKYADIIRNSETWKGANDATILRETHKHMSEVSLKRGKSLAGADDFKAGTALEKSDTDLLKAKLRDAADAAGMTSFRPAVTTHAENAGVLDAFSKAANAARRELGNASLMGEKQAKMGPAATRRWMAKLSKPEGMAAVDGILGRTAELMTPNSSMINLFGIPRALRGVYRAGPLLQAADRVAGSNKALWAERGLLSILNAR